MKFIYLIAFSLLILATTTRCSSGRNTVKVVKSKKHIFMYDQKKHANRKRTKTVRFKTN